MPPDFKPNAFAGRPVQILRMAPALLLDLLLDLQDRKLSLTDGWENLAGAKVVGCRQADDGLVWLYLERQGWPKVPEGDVPFIRHQGVRHEEGWQFTDRWASSRAVTAGPEVTPALPPA
jgi:hypothetical protein